MARSERLATCIGCGCDDHHACITAFGEGCHWLKVDSRKGFGVCSECPGHVKRFEKGDRRIANNQPAAVRQLNVALSGLSRIGKSKDKRSGALARKTLARIKEMV